MFCLSSRPTWLVFPPLFVGNTSSPVAKVGVRLRGGGVGVVEHLGGAPAPGAMWRIRNSPKSSSPTSGGGDANRDVKKSEPGALSAQA